MLSGARNGPVARPANGACGDSPMARVLTCRFHTAPPMYLHRSRARGCPAARRFLLPGSSRECWRDVRETASRRSRLNHPSGSPPPGSHRVPGNDTLGFLRNRPACDRWERHDRSTGSGACRSRDLPLPRIAGDSGEAEPAPDAASPCSSPREHPPRSGRDEQVAANRTADGLVACHSSRSTRHRSRVPTPAPLPSSRDLSSTSDVIPRKRTSAERWPQSPV